MKQHTKDKIKAVRQVMTELNNKIVAAQYMEEDIFTSEQRQKLTLRCIELSCFLAEALCNEIAKSPGEME